MSQFSAENPFFPLEQSSTAVTHEIWEQIVGELTPITQTTKEKPFYFAKDKFNNTYKIDNPTPKQGTQFTHEPRQGFTNIVMVNEEEMNLWLK